MCCSKAYSCSLMKFYPPYLAKILGFWVTCLAEMMPLRHGWGWKPPQTTSPIHIRHIQSVWAHWCVVQRYTVAALWSSTHPTWLRFWGSGSHVEPKWFHYVMVEADSHLKQLLPSTLDIYKVFECIDVLFKGIQLQPYEVLHTRLGSNFGFWVTCRSKMMPLFLGWGWQPPQTFPPSILDIYKVFECIDMMSKGIQLQPYEVLPTLLG